MTTQYKERIGWFLQRLSAVYLITGLFVHFWAVHYTLQRPLDFMKVTARFQSPGWIVFDLSLLLAAIYHGLNGMWQIFLDFTPGDKSKYRLGWVLFLIGLITFIWGIYILVPFIC